jgi:hypothetical protein
LDLQFKGSGGAVGTGISEVSRFEQHRELQIPEFCSFVILFTLFIIVLETNVLSRINEFEWFFMVFGIGK